LGEHFQVGHSYFTTAEIAVPQGRARIWQRAVLPLLEEYFYNRRDRADLLTTFALERLLPALGSVAGTTPA